MQVPAPRVARPPVVPVARVSVRVVDGDTGLPVPHALVGLGRHTARVDGQGLATLPVRRRTALPVTAWAPGYAAHVVRLDFARQPTGIVRVYRPAAQWPIYGATPERTQAPPSIRLRPPFRTVWSRGLGGLVEFPAVVSDGFAYATNFGGTVWALSMQDGSVAWRTETGSRMAASPAVWGDRLVVHGMDGAVRVLARTTGRVLARYAVGSPIESSPIVRDGIDYFGAWDGSVTALDLRRLRVRWRFWSGAKITSSASLAGGTLYIGDYGGRLWALDAATGRVRWSGGVNGRIYGTPAVAGGRVFVPSSDGGSLTAFSVGGARLWSDFFGSYVYSSPAAWGGRVFFGSYNGVFYSVSAATGRILWEVALGGPISGAAEVVDGVAYAGSFAHVIVGVEAASGRVLLRFPHGEYVPVSGNGGRLLLHGYSAVWAVSPAAPAGLPSTRATTTRSRTRSTGAAP